MKRQLFCHIIHTLEFGCILKPCFFRKSPMWYCQEGQAEILWTPWRKNLHLYVLGIVQPRALFRQ